MLLSFKHKYPKNQLLVVARIVCLVALFSFTYCGGPQDAAAQFDGDGVGAGDFGLPTDGGDFDGGGDGGGGIGGGGIGGGGIGGGGAGAFGDDFGDVLGGEQTTDQRNQGFVGATGERIQESGFVGPPGQSSSPPLADGASFGGGTNGGGGGATGGGGGRGNNSNPAFGGQGEEKGFQVFRSSVRANLRPRFATPQVSGSQVANRFQNRIRRIPNMGNDGGGVQISISNRTATIQGFVGSAEESSRLERQLRLEPGVYRVNNQTQVIGTTFGP